MRQQLLKKVNNLNTELTALLEDLEQFSSDQLNKVPAPNSWNATQVMNHLILSERYSVAYCEKKLSFEPTLKTAGLATKMRSKMVKYYLLSPFRFPAPKMIGTPSLPPTDNLQNIANLWQKERVQMAQFIENVPEKYLNKEVYKHPFGGRLSIDAMLDFFEVHFKHHKKQLYRAINS